MNVVNKCLQCNKELSSQHISRAPIRCKPCSKKGNLNGLYTNGERTKIRYCIDCRKLISRNGKAKRCLSCKWKFENKGIKNPMYGVRGIYHPLYINGRTPLRHTIRSTMEYRQWRSDIFTRDNFTCQNCYIRGGKIHAHHVKAFSIIMEENNIDSLKSALECSELWNINNGVTLCIDCHKMTDSFLKNSRNKNV